MDNRIAPQNNPGYLKRLGSFLANNKGKIAAVTTIASAAIAGAGVGAAVGAAVFGVGGLVGIPIGAVIGIAGGSVVVGGTWMGRKVYQRIDASLKARAEKRSVNWEKDDTFRNKMGKTPIGERIAVQVDKNALKIDHEPLDFKNISQDEDSQKILEEIKLYQTNYSPSTQDNNDSVIALLLVLFKAIENNKIDNSIKIQQMAEVIFQASKKKELYVGDTGLVNKGLDLLVDLVRNKSYDHLRNHLGKKEDCKALVAAMRTMVNVQTNQGVEDAENLKIVNKNSLIKYDNIHSLLGTLGVRVPIYTSTLDSTTKSNKLECYSGDFNFNEAAIYFKNNHYHVLMGGVRDIEFSIEQKKNS